MNSYSLESNPTNKILKIRFLQIPGQDFMPEQFFYSKEKKIVRIGRSKKAEVTVNDISISRIQCTLVFEKNEWVLYDGVYQNSKKSSTNGIW